MEGRNYSYTVFKNNAKRRRMFVQAVLAAVNQPRIRSIWVRLRSDAWFVMVLATYSEVQWYDDFRVTKTTL